MKSPHESGRTLVELLVAIALFLTMTAFAIPSLRAYSVQAYILGAGKKFESEFAKARSMAISSGAYTAIRFEDGPSGACYSVYRDGDHDGVTADDIERGTDLRIAGPFSLTAGAPGVSVGIIPGLHAIPPESGVVSGDPIKFGRSRMISFSPLGAATPGTFYLAGDRLQGAVRVTGNTGRVRLMIWDGAWRER